MYWSDELDMGDMSDPCRNEGPSRTWNWLVGLKEVSAKDID